MSTTQVTPESQGQYKAKAILQQALLPSLLRQLSRGGNQAVMMFK